MLIDNKKIRSTSLNNGCIFQPKGDSKNTPLDKRQLTHLGLNV